MKETTQCHPPFFGLPGLLVLFGPPKYCRTVSVGFWGAHFYDSRRLSGMGLLLYGRVLFPQLPLCHVFLCRLCAQEIAGHYLPLVATFPRTAQRLFFPSSLPCIQLRAYCLFFSPPHRWGRPERQKKFLLPTLSLLDGAELKGRIFSPRCRSIRVPFSNFTCRLFQSRGSVHYKGIEICGGH